MLLYPKNKKHIFKHSHILFHPHKPVWLKLNHTALEMADLLLNNDHPENIATKLSIKYNISKEIIANDIVYVSKELNKNHFFDLTPTSPTRKPELRSIFLNLTTRCNLHCPHCFIANSDQKKADIPFNKIEKLIEELAGAGGKSITLSGGEPMLHPQFKKIIEYIENIGLETRLLTNGTLIDRSMADFFSNKNIFIQISLDGSKKEIHDIIRGKGSFEKSIKAVKFLQDAGLGENLNFCTTIMNQNKNDIPEIINLTESLDVPLLRFLHLRMSGRAESYWESIVGMNIEKYESFMNHIFSLQENKKTEIGLTCGMSGFLLKLPQEFEEDEIWCPVGRMLIIDTDGEAYPCVLMMDQIFRLGNIFQDSLLDLIYSTKMKEVCENLANRKKLIKKCSKCTWKNFCQSGCMGQAIDHHNDIWKTDDFCSFRKKAYEKAFNKILNT